ncbi:MAG TPA: NAD(P)/FAD-dependent oxidoreductase [Thermoanaerobaculia bacterium]
MTDYDIAIVGAGAAGLTAAIFAAGTGARVVALDGAKRIGAKILISGGGRCNVTHDVVTPDDFNGNRNAVAKVLRGFTVRQTLDWFVSMGVHLKREETGKMFPVTDRAASVLDALLTEARRAGAEIRTDHRVERIERGFVLETNQGAVHARKVILATGGRSVPKTGSDGHGFVLARALGHTVTPLFPALVPLVLEPGHWITELSGTALMAELAVRTSTGRVVRRDRGSMLFTHFGLSGPVVLDVSRHWLASRRDDPGTTLTANFLLDATFESLEAELLAEARRNPRATAASVLRGRVPERLLERLTSVTPLSQLSKEERRALVRAFVEHPLPVVRDRGFDYAEVTAGGVPLTEVEVSTMASRVCEGLYLCGEVLDVDGKIGGYNFQWAWASGRLAGVGAQD